MPAAKKTAARKTPKAQAAKPLAPMPTKPKAKAAKPAKAEKAAKPAAKADKADKAKKPKLVRDTFRIPKNEYGLLEELKQRAAKLGRPTKKSEVLRAGVMALAGMGDATFLATVSGVPAVKAARPAKSAV